MSKQKVYLLVENLERLGDNSDFDSNNSGFDKYLFQLIVLLKTDFKCSNSFSVI